MIHIENIKKLFDRNFVESPLVESFEAGDITLTSGKLAVSDPLITSEMPAFTTDFPLGNFPVLVHKEIDSNCIAYVEIVFSNSEIASWKLATSEGQNTGNLQEGEIFGFPVESGMGCLMDFETQQNLNLLEQHLFKRKGDDFMGIYEEFFHEHFFQEEGAINQYAFLKPNEDKSGNIFAFETGYGEGFYASYIGFDEQNVPVKVVCELIEIN
ncbi:DUF4241 domain-containing protein [Kaistella yonginensis]|uniref:DUF4241 domain-containing protein n=1 Tax=Kaistella yonginensis TaxID=658267 RepID=UPI0025B5C37E|nr:DUF4241 domain-containing protein [Kaistella yonginensis]MDN3605505.1 DUF4241 domain-containing protein [Kaistella yonginensis]